MKPNLKKFIPHIFVFLAFTVIALLYFHPVLQGKVIFQSDIAQYVGMAEQANDFREQTGEETYWTNSAFGGMPTYQLGAYYPNDLIDEVDAFLRFVPRPADYLFLYFIGIYILLLVLKVDWKPAFLGALAFGFSTYLIIILGVGHNSKAHAIAYMPLVVAGVLLVFRNKWLWGFLLLAVSMALEINANHFQMTYYLLLLILVIGIVFLIDAYKKKILPQFFKSVGIMIVAVVLALGTNATNLLATSEYTEFSTRGQSELKLDNNAENNSGLDYDYITEYSYGAMESFNLFIPRFMGGSNAEKVDSETFGKDVALPLYWGDQPIVAAPAYLGATVLFLFVLGLFLVKGRFKKWIITGSVLALLLSWGDNFELLTRFFINYFPLYDKFRAVSSIQVIIELCVPVMAAVGLCWFFNNKTPEEEKQKALKWSTIILGSLAVIFLIFKNSFDFVGVNDAFYRQRMGADFVNALVEERKAVFTSDTLRSLILVLLMAGLTWLLLKKKLNKNLVMAGFAALILFDLVGVNLRYVSPDDFVKPRDMEQPFTANAADKQIMKDDGHFRVLDLSGNPFNSARASFFHNSIGGYHGAKPRRIQDLYTHYISQGNQEILNMLNTKYFILENQGQFLAQPNPDANGNAWFVEKVDFTENTTESFLALKDFDSETTAVVNKRFSDLIKKQSFNPAESDTIYLKNHQPNEMVYEYSIGEEQLAVFSEIYYPDGWNAYVDGQKVPHFRADYVLRAMVLPAGSHELVFKFEPQVVKTGSTIAVVSCIVLGLCLLGGLWFFYKKNLDSKSNPRIDKNKV
jgi:hypothetical protein